MNQLPLIAGIIMGLGSSLHCLGMCGPIACAITLAGPRDMNSQQRLAVLMSAQFGKAISYAVLGGLFGVFGAGLYGVMNFEAGHMVLQWTAALSLIWMGLSIAGLVPAMAGLDRVLAPIAGQVTRLRTAGAMGGPTDGVLAGLIWGLMPCAMVYIALFNSLLAGSILNGAMLMLGFGLGTIPAVSLSAMGLNRLTRFGRTARGRLWAGLGLAAAGILALLLTAPGSPLCIMPVY